MSTTPFPRKSNSVSAVHKRIEHEMTLRALSSVAQSLPEPPPRSERPDTLRALEERLDYRQGLEERRDATQREILAILRAHREELDNLRERLKTVERKSA